MKANPAPLLARVGRWSLLYGGLGVVAAVFLWPVIWMVGASLKSGQEVFDSPQSVVPQRPLPRAASPYLNLQQFDFAAAQPAPDRLRLVAGLLREMDAAWPADTPPAQREAARQAAARGVCRRLADLLPAEVWRQPAPERRRALQACLTPALVDGVRAQMRRELLFGSLRLRSRDTVEEEVLVPASDATSGWEISGDGHARFEPVEHEGQPAGRLHYDFGPGGEIIRLTRTFHTPTDVSRLERLQLSLRSDESWHALRLFVEAGGALHQAERATALSEYEHWSLLTWQPPGPDDQTNKVRTWTTLRESARGPQYVRDPHTLKVTVEIRRVGTLGAWAAKLRRNYALALDHLPFWRYAATSVFLVVLSVLGTLLSCSLAGYSFARLRWPGRDLCFVLLLATLMIPPQVTLMPQFLIMRDLGWYNTLLPLWVPHFFGAAFYVFLLRQFFKGVPRELEEAARLDGAGPLQIYWHVMLPLAQPTLAAVAVLSFMANWNDFMGPLIYVSDQRLYPLSFGLYAFTVQTNSEAGLGMGMTMAGSLLMMLPVVVIFLLAQRYFLQSAVLSGLKG